MIHDFCGGLEEEMMRTNFILIYELIDELIVKECLQFYIYLGFWLSIDNTSRNFKEVRSYIG